MHIRQASPDDLPAIAAIQQASPEASSWAPLDYTCDVAVEDGRVAGFIVTRTIAPDESEILNLAVDPYYRRRGIAKALVRHAVGRTPGRWFLEVRESNVSALQLYMSLGFLSAGRRQKYYNHPPESAIVMSFFS
jgi:ribosomal-protein-alanine N-acetyltransferase